MNAQLAPLKTGTDSANSEITLQRRAFYERIGQANSTPSRGRLK